MLSFTKAALGEPESPSLKEWLRQNTTMEDDFFDLRRERIEGTGSEQQIKYLTLYSFI